jgi:hypothetical protein
MKQKIILIILAVALLVMTACDGGQAPGPSKTGFVGGTRGVDVAFVTNAPPQKISDRGQEPFDVVVELTNRGEHEILKEDVFVRLEGFSASAFGVTNADLIARPEDDLFPVRKSPDGSIITSPSIPVIFEGLSYQADAPANIPFTFRANACYTYETLVLADICVKNNFNDDRQGDLCKVSGPRTVSNSGAPVQVVSLRQAPQGRDKTTVTFAIQQRDTDQAGRVSRTNSECSIAQQDENRVFVSVTGLTTSTRDTVRCIGLLGGDSSSGHITLTRNEPREVSCTVTLEDRNTRVQPFRITLGYDYSTYKDTIVTVIYTPE